MKRALRYLIILAMTILLCGASAAAADYTPGKAGSLKASSVSETKVTLKWSKGSKATGYYVYRVTTSGLKKVATVSKTTCTVKNLTPGTTYQFKILAYRKVKKKIYKAADYSNTVTVTPQIKKPSKPTKLSVSTDGNKTLAVSWNKSTNATGYEVYRYKDGKYTKVSTTKKTSVTFGNLTAGTKYTYVVRSYRKVGSAVAYSAYSASATGTPVELSTDASSIHGIRYNGTVKKKVQVYDYTAKKQITLKKGTKIISTAKSGKTYTAYLTNGHKIKISSSYVKITSLAVSSKTDYSTSAKEEFVNSKNLSSSTRYLICIDQTKARVNIFKGSKGNWKLVRTFKVIIGKYGSMSPRGVKKIRYKWASRSYGQPEIQWTGSVPGSGNAFHARVDGTALGKAASHGCIRCNTSDLWYMYNHCAVGTTVYSY